MVTSGDNDRTSRGAAQAPWLIAPARGWQRKTNRLFWMPLRRPLLGIAAMLLIAVVLDYLWLVQLHGRFAWWIAHLALAILLTLAVLTMLRGMQRRLHEPLAHLRAWAQRVREGDLGARIPTGQQGEFALLAADINRLSDELQQLAQDMERRVQTQTGRLAQKNQSLEILYDMAASLNAAHDLDDLLARFLQTLMKVVSARAATVRLLTDDGYMRLVASIGIDKVLREKEELMPADCSACGRALASGDIVRHTELHRCSREIDHPFFEGEPLEMVVVPLQYRDKTLGLYNLFTDNPRLAADEDMHDLLISIGRHLGMAVEKSRLDTESQRLALMQERQTIANELHDSLAQSLASLRIQVKMLDETLQESGNAPARHEIAQIKRGMDNAHRELRELLLHCRAPMDERGLMPAIEEIVDRFRADTSIAVFLQKDCAELALPPDLEVQVLRIVQESLANVRKYSQARNVRVLLACDRDGNHRVLVEDDGLGIVQREGESLPGEHLGLSIMQERARLLGGILSVESEPGEGTRVLLNFSYHPARASAARPH